MHKFVGRNERPVWIDLAAVKAVEAAVNGGSAVCVAGEFFWVDEKPEEVALLIETLRDLR